MQKTEIRWFTFLCVLTEPLMTICNKKVEFLIFLSQASYAFVCDKNSVQTSWRTDAGDGLWHLRWQTELLSLEYFCNVQIEEVTVENSLDHTSNNSYEVKETLKIVAPNPIN